MYIFLIILIVFVCYSAVWCRKKVKGKGFPYSLPSVGPGADPGVQAVSPQMTISHPPGGRLPLLFARPAVTFPVAEHHCLLVDTNLCCLMTEAHRCKQLAQGFFAAFALSRIWTHNLLIASPMLYLLHHCATSYDAVVINNNNNSCCAEHHIMCIQPIVLGTTRLLSFG